MIAAPPAAAPAERASAALAHSAVTPTVRLAPMTAAQLPAVLAVEQVSHDHPWTQGNFLDSLHAGWRAQCLIAGGDLLGYYVAMPGVDEAHLLNLTVAPVYRRQGWARVMLDALGLWARTLSATALWLEVRASNVRALQLYAHYGFMQTGLRKGYYLTQQGQPEDAVLMICRL
jgi:ribosomal-protein-alanine N-acetyltransferase